MSDNSFERLQALRNQIGTAKSSRDKLDGALTSELKRLKELGADSYEEGVKTRDSLQRQEAKLVKQVDSGLAELEQEYEW